MLERSLEEGVARKTDSTSRGPYDFSRLSGLSGQSHQSDQEEDEDTKDLRPTGFVTEDATSMKPKKIPTTTLSISASVWARSG
jgi:hypothetical protein